MKRTNIKITTEKRNEILSYMLSVYDENSTITDAALTRQIEERFSMELGRSTVFNWRKHYIGAGKYRGSTKFNPEQMTQAITLMKQKLQTHPRSTGSQLRSWLAEHGMNRSLAWVGQKLCAILRGQL